MAKKIMADAWASFEKAVMPNGASHVQRTEMRRAFYAGAQGVLGGMLSMLDPGHEPTEDDYKVMDGVEQELEDFQKDVSEGRA